MKTLTKYGILIVVSNRLYLVLVIGLHTRYGVQIPIYLERGRKPYDVYFVWCQVNDVQIPIYLARGRKLISVLVRTTNRTICIAPNIPPRGAGNFQARKYDKKGSHQYRYLSTSRGAGNLLISEIFDSIFFVYLPIYLARGRKHNFRCAERSLITYRYLSISRGGGNRNDQNISSFGSVQIPIYLARGRKLCS